MVAPPEFKEMISRPLGVEQNFPDPIDQETVSKFVEKLTQNRVADKILALVNYPLYGRNRIFTIIEDADFEESKKTATEIKRVVGEVLLDIPEWDSNKFGNAAVLTKGGFKQFREDFKRPETVVGQVWPQNPVVDFG